MQALPRRVLDTTESSPDAGMAVAAAEACLSSGDFAAAATRLREALRSAPDDVRLLLNLGGALKELGRFDEALAVLCRAVALDPRRHGAWSNIGTVCLELQRYDDAIAAFANALALKHDHGPALSGMGVTLRRRGLPDEALRFFDLAVGLAPDDAELITNRSLAHLALGDYRRGFMQYERRLQTAAYSAALPAGPSWKGEPLAGRTLLLHGEGGLGDILQFCRFIPTLKAMDCRVAVQVPPPLVRLIARNFGIPTLSTGTGLPAYDVFCPLMSLPYALGMTDATIPFPGGYLTADPDIVAGWRAVLDADMAHALARGAIAPGGQPLRVGLVWSGGERPWHLQNWLMNERRSLSLSALAPLAACGDGVLFYSLQLGRPARELATPPPGLSVIDHTGAIGDFDDTAGLVTLLDLVIAVDTSTAHLAAALGRPVWLLSRYDQCWRWMVGRSDTPWYRTMEIVTQTTPLDWSGPVDAATRRLLALCGPPA